MAYGHQYTDEERKSWYENKIKVLEDGSTEQFIDMLKEEKMAEYKKKIFNIEKYSKGRKQWKD